MQVVWNVREEEVAKQSTVADGGRWIYKVNIPPK